MHFIQHTQNCKGRWEVDYPILPFSRTTIELEILCWLRLRWNQHLKTYTNSKSLISPLVCISTCNINKTLYSTEYVYFNTKPWYSKITYIIYASIQGVHIGRIWQKSRKTSTKIQHLRWIPNTSIGTVIWIDDPMYSSSQSKQRKATGELWMGVIDRTPKHLFEFFPSSYQQIV